MGGRLDWDDGAPNVSPGTIARRLVFFCSIASLIAGESGWFIGLVWAFLVLWLMREKEVSGEKWGRLL